MSFCVNGSKYSGNLALQQTKKIVRRGARADRRRVSSASVGGASLSRESVASLAWDDYDVEDFKPASGCSSTRASTPVVEGTCSPEPDIQWQARLLLQEMRELRKDIKKVNERPIFLKTDVKKAVDTGVSNNLSQSELETLLAINEESMRYQDRKRSVDEVVRSETIQWENVSQLIEETELEEAVSEDRVSEYYFEENSEDTEDSSEDEVKVSVSVCKVIEAQEEDEVKLSEELVEEDVDLEEVILLEYEVVEPEEVRVNEVTECLVAPKPKQTICFGLEMVCEEPEGDEEELVAASPFETDEFAGVLVIEKDNSLESCQEICYCLVSEDDGFEAEEADDINNDGTCDLVNAEIICGNCSYGMATEFMPKVQLAMLEEDCSSGSEDNDTTSSGSINPKSKLSKAKKKKLKKKRNKQKLKEFFNQREKSESQERESIVKKRYRLLQNDRKEELLYKVFTSPRKDLDLSDKSMLRKIASEVTLSDLEKRVEYKDLFQWEMNFCQDPEQFREFIENKRQGDDKSIEEILASKINN